MISVQNLCKAFQLGGKALPILKGVSFSIQKGEMLAIVGPSGVGKSTLLGLLGGLDRPTSGKVLFEGMDLFALSDAALAAFRNSKIGFVFQFHHLLQEFSALENVMMPGMIRRMPHREIEAAARDLLQRVGLSHRMNHRPGELSGGEQQRVAIARALVLKPRLVLADEPTGNLDTHTSDAVFGLLKDLNKKGGMTFVLVTHNEKLSLQTDRIIRMVDGQVSLTQEARSP